MNSQKKQRTKEKSRRRDLPAGRFSSWLCTIRSTLVRGNEAHVPCGGCYACCRSSNFIHIAPEEIETLNRIPQKLLFAAPGFPKGNVLMGYNKKGKCPMLIKNTCSIYEHRPLTCRTFDCRIFPATGISASDNTNASLVYQAPRWKFSYPNVRDRKQHSAVQAAARYLKEHSHCFHDKVVPSSSIQLAILAIIVFDVFMKNNEKFGNNEFISQDFKIAKAIMETYRKFEKRRLGRITAHSN